MSDKMTPSGAALLFVALFLLTMDSRGRSSMVSGLLSLNDSTTRSGAVATDSSKPTFTSEFKRVCRGTNTGLGHGSGHVEQYRAIYSNCTYVDGNLEIVFVEDPTVDLSFLRHIREVTGYVLIVANHVSYIPLTSLRIIRGRTLFEQFGKYYSLYVALNYDVDRKGVGLQELRFTSLHEILAGHVMFYDNRELCLEDTIEWKDIITSEVGTVEILAADKQRTCPKCHQSCFVGGNGHCWGTGPEYCQKLTKLSCSPQCDGRCFGPLPSQCCHPECAGGCTGPTKSDCWACKNFDNDELCENFCPPEYIYSPTLFKQVLNPRAKYAYGSLCVDTCPSHLMADKGACVQDCGAGRVAGKDNKCVDCDGPCPKVCVFAHDVVNENNTQELIGCTVIQGHIKILDQSFRGDSYWNIPSMKVERLDVLRTVREVTDYVLIQANNPEFRSLSFLENLAIIQGRTLAGDGTSLQVFQTSLEYLGLVSLSEVRNGHIYIANNSRLCYSSTIRWDTIRTSPSQKVFVMHNRNATACVTDNEVCNAECTAAGCWGPLDDQCVNCTNYHLGKRCLNTCESVSGVFTFRGNECQRCNEECSSSCDGPGADDCDGCRNARDGPYCVPECPISKYRDEEGICQMCHENCAEGAGCTGPRNSIGPGACNSCALVIVVGDEVNCLTPDTPCDSGYYRHYYTPLPGVQACLRCHPECRTCNGQGLSFCMSCVNFEQDGRCVKSCSSDYYVEAKPGSSSGKCLRCDSRCLRCTGPTAGDCVSCKQYKIYLNYAERDIDPRFNCTEKCPDEAPFKETQELADGETETVCVSVDSFAKKRTAIIVGATAGGVALFCIIIIVAIILCIQKQRAERERNKLTAKMTGCDESVPLYPTDAKPDMSLLRLIKESELSRGQIIGSGAFGTVYKGLWTPAHGGVKTPVAIKIIQEGTSSTHNKELLEEARIMASVVHPCCVQILAICMTAQIMLVSELMPLGCLLEFVRKKQSQNQTPSSHTLLLWSKQIAQGMAHLEAKQIVHRDLAARNVLVQNTNQVKITDFGLAKLLDYKEYQFIAKAGKMPIKWLALECIQHRKFTHKSDVWSFGVTLWELYTYGMRPYENVHAMELPELLEKGERLPQPPICTIDVYMLMVKCWTVVAEDRPTFTELADEFEKMSREPQRYLVVRSEQPMEVFTDPAHEDYHHGRYIAPQPSRSAVPMDKVVEEGTIEVYIPGDHARPSGRRPNQRSANGASLFHPSNRRSTSSSRYCSDPCIQQPYHGAAPDIATGDADEYKHGDGYMEPSVTTRDGAVKYIHIVDDGKVDHEEDDGFDSESTVTPATPVGGQNEYYNSLELHPLKSYGKGTSLPHSSGAKKSAVRGNSESIGSLDTEGTGSAGSSDVSDHDPEYYNDFPMPCRPKSDLLNTTNCAVSKPPAQGPLYSV